MKILRTQHLIVRNWREDDRELFHRINSDPVVMEFFPSCRSRKESDAFMDEERAAINTDGYGWTAVELAATGPCMGWVGLKETEIDGVAPAGSHEIGWRLMPEFWGMGYVTEAASALADFAFETVRLADIISFAVWNNVRSTAVMERLGMRHTLDFVHPSIPETHPHLKPFKLYRLSKSDWQARGHR